MQVISLKCPNCGESLTSDMKKCPSCRGPVVISTFNDIAALNPLQTNKYIASYQQTAATHPENLQVHVSIAMCYFKLKLYDRALVEFEKALNDNFEDSDLYLYAAICLLKGKKPFLQQRSVIDKIVEYLNAALMITPKGIYYLMLAYVKRDYFDRKFYSTQPSSAETLAEARATGYSEADALQLFQLIGVDAPTEFLA